MDKINVFVTKEGKEADVFQLWSELVSAFNESFEELSETDYSLDPDDFIYYRGIIDSVFSKYDETCNSNTEDYKWD